MELDRDSKSNPGPAADFAAARGEAGTLLDAPSDNELARFCLELDPAESKRALAWVTSICAVYLLIGIVGLRPPALAIMKKQQVEEAVPTVIEPLVTPVQTITPDSSAEDAVSEKSQDEGPPVIAVTVDSAAVAFSVPTVGNMVVPMSMAQAPPAHPMQGAVPVSNVQIERISATGVGGSRPAPPYPADSLVNREQGTVVVLIEVDETGRITTASVKESSGFWRLDKETVDYVRRHWLFGPAKGQRVYEAPIVYQLQ